MIPSNRTSEAELCRLYAEHINPAYPLFLRKLGLEKVAVKAEGARITDSEGETYIDCTAGYGIYNLGHNHPKIIDALTDQMNQKQPCTRPFLSELPVKLAKRLSDITPGDLTCSFLCSSGSEAIDNAIKLARLHTGKKTIVTAENSFHGYTFGALSASGISSFKHFFQPMVPNFIHIPFGEIGALDKALTEDVAAVLLEPIQHEAGVLLPPRNYFREARELCTKRGILLILDEIKTGFGKTGSLFACNHFETVPDIMVIGKSLGGGLIPIGGLISRKTMWKKFGLSFPMSASTYSWNLLACRAAFAVTEILEEEGLVRKTLEKGRFFLDELKKLSRKYSDVLRGAEGLGLLMGIETVSPQKAMQMCREIANQGVLMLPAFGNPAVLMVEPPLVITFDEIRKVLRSLELACTKLADRGESSSPRKKYCLPQAEPLPKIGE
jgi:putrescine aminotransferase